jgi:hypothetical protein
MTYTVVVRIWDAKQREATPGDPTYVEVTRDFTFVPGATTGTTSLTAVAQDPKPAVLLTWQRTSAPDRFNVLRNGKIIAAGLLPDPPPVGVFLSGTSYQWTDPSPSPARSLTYSVQAVVGGVASASNASAVVTVRSRGIWLKDPTSGLELCILGREGREFTLGEQAAVLQSIAVNANKVAINQGLGGLEGHLAGTLSDFNGKTAQEWRDIYIQLRNLRVRSFWVTVGDYTFLAVCQGWTYQQRALPRPVFDVGFDFYQQDSINTLLLGS